MDKRRHHGLIDGLRAELVLFLRVTLIVLAVPLIHPLAEAEAAGRGQGGGHAGVICTAFGANHAAGDQLPGAPDECPCGVLCAISALALPANTVSAAAVPLRPETPVAVLLGAEGASRPTRSVRPPGHAPPVLS
jgi:hypothetical protein